MLSTVERAVQVMAALGRRPDGLTLSQLAREVGSNKQAVFRVARTLAAFHFVAADPHSGRLQLGAGLLRLADGVRADLDLRRISLPALTRLRDVTGETACLHVMFGRQRTCIVQVESRDELRWVAELGKPFPLTGAPGKTFLAFLPEVARSPRLRPVAVADELARVRRQGYAVARDETVAGVSSVSAPVFDASGRVVAAATLLGPSSRLTREVLGRHAGAVCEAARRISALLGKSAPAPRQESSAVRRAVRRRR
jgi:IclR family acetate operon transcriptional repressor